MHRNPKTLTTFFSSGTKRLLIFLTFSFSTRGERDTIFTMLTVPTLSFSQLPQLNCSAQSSISTNWPNKRAVHPVALSWTALAQSQISTAFSKITKIPSPSFPGMMSFTPQSHFLSGASIMTFVIVTPSAREREHLHWEPNSSKPNQTEW